jgi:hypothetical protein
MRHPLSFVGLVPVAGIHWQNRKRVFPFEDSGNDRRGNALYSLDSRHAFGRELVKMIIRPETTAREDAGSSRREPQKEYLRELG